MHWLALSAVGACVCVCVFLVPVRARGCVSLSMLCIWLVSRLERLPIYRASSTAAAVAALSRQPRSVDSRCWLGLQHCGLSPVDYFSEETCIIDSSNMAAAVKTIRKKQLKERALAAFDRYDQDGSGLIDKAELMLALEELGMKVTGMQANKVLSKYLPEGSGVKELDRDQFNQLVQDLRKYAPQKKQRSFAVRSATRLRATVSVRDDVEGESLCKCLPIWRGHEHALVVYNNKWMQLSVAGMILANFLVNVWEKEVDPFPAELQLMKRTWDQFDMAFNIIFLFGARASTPRIEAVTVDCRSSGNVACCSSRMLLHLAHHPNLCSLPSFRTHAQSSSSTYGAAAGRTSGFGDRVGTGSTSSSSLWACC